MMTNKVVITSPARVFQLGIHGYKNPRFSIENIHSTRNVSHEDESIALLWPKPLTEMTLVKLSYQLKLTNHNNSILL